MMLPARLQKMAARRMRLKLSRKVVQVPEMPMIETSLDVLFLNHSLRPPLNELYLKETKAFYTSKIHFFNGKHWQLRTLTANGKHYIVPIMVNTGGIAHNHLRRLCPDALSAPLPEEHVAEHRPGMAWRRRQQMWHRGLEKKLINTLGHW